MLYRPDYMTARRFLLEAVSPVSPERMPLSLCAGRVLAECVTAAEDVPPFDRSAYDGYALRAEDSAGAADHAGVTLKVAEEVCAGAVPAGPCGPGQAVKIHTGAPVPAGVSAVVRYEDTSFSEKEVTIFSPLKPGDNIVRAGEDTGKGELLVRRGGRIDPGTLGALAAQGLPFLEVYRIPKVALFSAGDELIEPGERRTPGRIYDANRYMLAAALRDIGCEPVCLGLAPDSGEAIRELLLRGLSECDAVICTGGVSAGERDLVPWAMERAGVDILVRGVRLKPGMACAYGLKDGKLICALSGNPASAFTNFHAVVAPALRKLAGLARTVPKKVLVTLGADFEKSSPTTRLLRGSLELSDGMARLMFSKSQGNAVLTSAAGCDVMAVIPAGSGPAAAGTVLEGFLL